MFAEALSTGPDDAVGAARIASGRRKFIFGLFRYPGWKGAEVAEGRRKHPTD